MRSEMHRPQIAFECADCSGLNGETIWRHLSFGEKAVEQQFMPDEFLPEWLGSGAHPLKDNLNLPTLSFGQLEFVGQGQNMLRAGIPVKLSRLCHAHPFTVDQGGNVLRRERLDRSGLLARVRRWGAVGER